MIMNCFENEIFDKAKLECVWIGDETTTGPDFTSTIVRSSTSTRTATFSGSSSTATSVSPNPCAGISSGEFWLK